MTPTPEPFLSAAAFSSMLGRSLTAPEALQVTPLLEVVSRWIRQHSPGIEADDPGAITVSFDVARDALTYGKFRALSSFSRETSHSKESGVLQFREIERFITARHREMLGVSVSPRPRYYFGD